MNIAKFYDAADKVNYNIRVLIDGGDTNPELLKVICAQLEDIQASIDPDLSRHRALWNSLTQFTAAVKSLPPEVLLSHPSRTTLELINKLRADALAIVQGYEFAPAPLKVESSGSAQPLYTYADVLVYLSQLQDWPM